MAAIDLLIEGLGVESLSRAGNAGDEQQGNKGGRDRLHGYLSVHRPAAGRAILFSHKAVGGAVTEEQGEESLRPGLLAACLGKAQAVGPWVSAHIDRAISSKARSFARMAAAARALVNHASLRRVPGPRSLNFRPP